MSPRRAGSKTEIGTVLVLVLLLVLVLVLVRDVYLYMPNTIHTAPSNRKAIYIMGVIVLELCL
jgi:hypothetical protein